MGHLTELFSRQRTVFHPPGIETKKQCLEFLSRSFHDWNPNLKQREVLEALHTRERMGHTAITENIAIPHARVPGLEAPAGVLMLLEPAVSFDHTNEHSVSLIFGMLAPEDADDQHVHTLRELAQLLSDKQNTAHLLQSNNADQLWQQFSKMVLVPTT